MKEIALGIIKNKIDGTIEKIDLKKQIYKQSYDALVLSQKITEDIIGLYLFTGLNISEAHAEIMNKEVILNIINSDLNFGNRSSGLRKIINEDSVGSLNSLILDDEIKKYSKDFIDSEDILIEWLSVVRNNLILRNPSEFIRHRDRVIEYLKNNKKYKKIVPIKISTFSEYREYMIECIHNHGFKKVSVDYCYNSFYEYRWMNRKIDIK